MRLGNKQGKYAPIGSQLIITTGWNLSDLSFVGYGEVTEITTKQIVNFTDKELEGESPDILTVQAITYVLSQVYRKVVYPEDTATLIRWKWLLTLQDPIQQARRPE